MKRAVVLVATAALAAAAASPADSSQSCPPGAHSRCGAVTARAARLITDSTTGGSFGFLLAEVGGPVYASYAPDRVFYPASSIKVLQLLHAVRWIQQDGAATLEAPVPVYADTCTGRGPSSAQPLRDLLAAMMIHSDNAAANAVQDYFGTEALAATASLAGMTDTAVHHRFGCGGPLNDPANRTTAADLVALYTAVADGSLLDSPHRDLFDSFMLDEDTGSIGPALEAAAAGGDTGGPAQDALRNRLHVVSKAGWYGPRLSIAGLAEVPTRIGTRVFAFAVWVEPDATAAGFAVEAVVAELLRDPLGEALASLDAPRLTRPRWGPIPV